MNVAGEFDAVIGVTLNARAVNGKRAHPRKFALAFLVVTVHRIMHEGTR